MSLLPRSLLARTVLLLALVLLLAQAASVALFGWSEREPRVRQVARQVASAVNLTRAALLHTSSAARLELLRELSEQEGIRVLPGGEAGVPPPMAGPRPLVRMLEAELRRELGPGTRVRFAPGDGGVLWVSFALGREAYWMVLPRARLERPFPWHWVGWGAVLGVLAVAGAWLIVSRVATPLRRLTQAAADIGRGSFPPPLAEEGPDELRRLTRSFNAMAADLQRLDADRRLMLAGVSHDLRTPLARLRLAVEMVPDAQGRAGMVQDIEDMDAIVGQFVDFARDAEGDPPVRCDLNALAGAVCERYRAAGHAVAAALAPLPPMLLRRGAVQRALSNLVENAIKYGHAPGAAAEIEVRSGQAQGMAWLAVLDRGPGIPPGEAERVKQPFARLDAARGNASGAGLGLAIVERFAREHGGRLLLLPRQGGGLEARLELPVSQR